MNGAKLEGKVLIVTGGTQGLGRGIALMAAAHGASGLVVCGRNARNGENVAAELRSTGCVGHFIRADLRNVAECRKVVQYCDRQFGRVDGLVNAAGLTNRGTLEDTTEELWNLLFEVNARAPFFLMQEAVKVMKREKIGGSIVNILSISAHGGQPFITPYCGAKGALAIITKNAAHSLRWDRIRVNGVNIGWTYTDNEQKVQEAEGKPQDWLAEAEKSRPFGRLLYPDDVAKLVVYLLSDDAEMMTGALIDFDQTVLGAFD